ncbi:rubredoxin [Candidatus Bathyarchaeota archaeon]|nr:rubredoxin [Candidatus Bathyarchaeota archaeon]
MAPETPFDKLPDNRVCPICGHQKTCLGELGVKK